MSVRYVPGPAPRAVFIESHDGIGATASDIIVADDLPQDSGLLDASGRMLYRVTERLPFGFQGRGR